MILYIDVNNLFGWTKVQALPYGQYENVTHATADDSENG